MASRMVKRYAPKLAPQLQPGEQVQEVFQAQTKSGWWAILSYWISGKIRVVAATDRRILVFEGSKFSAKVGALLRELPRSTRIGPMTGLWYKTDVLGERLYIARGFKRYVDAMDSMAPGA